MFDISNLYVGRRRTTRPQNAEATEQRRKDFESVTLRGFLADEAEEAARVEAERLAAVNTAKAELSRNLTALRNEQRTRATSMADDPSIFEDNEQPLMFGTQAEADAYNREQVRIFLQQTPSYYADNAGQNLQKIFEYLQRNGRHVIVSAKVLAQVFERLSSLGMLIEKPAPVPAPAPTRSVPAAPLQTEWDIDAAYTGRNRATDLFVGYDPNGSGQRVKLTARQIDKLSMDQYKVFSRVTVQRKPDYARIDDREMSGAELASIQLFESPSSTLRKLIPLTKRHFGE